MLTLLTLFACHKDGVDTSKPPPYGEDFAFKARVGDNLRDVGDRADRVVAIPHTRGAVGMQSMTPVVGSIGDEGSFELTLSSKSDWAIFLVDSAPAGPRDRVVATVELGLDDASMVSIVGETVTGDIDAGTLVEGDGTATSSTSSEKGAAPVSEVAFPEGWVTSNKAPAIANEEPVFATAWVTTSLGDNGVSVIWYDLCPDADGDGAPTCTEGQEADQWPTVHPGLPEQRRGLHRRPTHGVGGGRCL